jgi:hypothetical protein
VDVLLWVIVVVIVLAVLIGGFLAYKARSRRGGVIVDPSGPAGPGREPRR